MAELADAPALGAGEVKLMGVRLPLGAPNIGEDKIMRDPKKVLTEEGFRKLQAHLVNIEEGLFFITNHADDLHIGAMDEGKALDTLYDMQELIESKHLETGDGEEDE